jgi:ribosomal protein S18 acetylase RimI-like enzyme
MTSLAPSPALLSTRAATEADIPLLRDLAERTWRVSYAEMLTTEQIDYMLAWMYSPEQIAKEMRERVVWEVALHESRPIGFLSVAIDGRQAKLNKLYVLPEWQGRGFSAALLRRVDEIAAAREAQEIWLQVNKRNERARRAYERAGYSVAREAIFDIGGGFVMDDFLLRRDRRTSAGS